jgi:hypothetical protein
MDPNETLPPEPPEKRLPDEHAGNNDAAPKAETAETTAPQPATDMEVHHHAHDPAAPHHKKNWKSYFWEFLMLFLAVFCGFLAENQREHYIEKVRAKEYARSLINDLKNDTLMVNVIIKEMEISRILTDSMISYLYNKPIEQIQNFELYRWGLADDLYRPYSWNRATLEQIKNSGSIRYFKNDSIIHRITAYDAFTDHMDEDFKGDEERSNRVIEKRNQIVDLNYSRENISRFRLKTNMDSLRRTEYYNDIIKNGPRLLTSDINDIKKYVNEKITIRQFLNSRGERELPKLKKAAKELIELLKKEYHLK